MVHFVSALGAFVGPTLAMSATVRKSGEKQSVIVEVDGSIHTAAYAAQPNSSDEYDCDAGVDNWRKGWSQAKRNYCCSKYGTGCGFDCDAAFEEREKGWSDLKKTYCCKNENKGCTQVPDDADAAHRQNFFRSAISNITDLPSSHRAAHASFEEFVKGNARKYHNDYNVSEYVVRLGHFANTLKMIEARNAQEELKHEGARAFHGVNKYADWTQEEFRSLLGFKTPEKNGSSAFEGGASLRGASVAPCDKTWKSRVFIRNQGACGDCFAFSSVETLRAAYIEEHGTDPGRLSTQFIVDCQQQKTCSGGVNGCCGGWPIRTLEWIREQGGIPTQEAYGDYFQQSQASSLISGGPVSHSGEGITYSGNNPTTSFPCKANIPKAVTLTEASQLSSEDDMANHVCNKGTLSIAVDASAWQTYVGGIISASSCGTNLDHAVAIAGISQSKNAWIVQNSWGTDWGVTIEGEDVPKDKYSNCASLAKQYGCSQALQGGVTVGQVCLASCSDGKVANGGFIFLQYGENTCGIAQAAVAASGTSAVGGSSPGPASTTASTTTSTAASTTNWWDTSTTASTTNWWDARRREHRGHSRRRATETTTTNWWDDNNW